MNRYLIYLSAIALCVMLASAPAQAKAGQSAIGRGDSAMSACEYDDAISAYREALEAEPYNGELMVKLANAYEGVKWFGRSVELWENYMAEYPMGAQAAAARQHAAENHRWLGSYQFLIGDSPEVASGHLRRAIELDPTMIDAYRWLARVLNSEARFTASIDVLDRAAARSKAPDEGIKKLREEALRGNMRDGIARSVIDRGIRLFDEGHPASALSVFHVAGALNPKATSVNYWKGRSFMAVRRYKEAARSFQTYYGTTPRNYRVAWLHEQAEQNAGSPLSEIDFYKRLPSLHFPKAAADIATQSRMPGSSAEVCLLEP